MGKEHARYKKYGDADGLVKCFYCKDWFNYVWAYRHLKLCDECCDKKMKEDKENQYYNDLWKQKWKSLHSRGNNKNVAN